MGGDTYLNRRWRTVFLKFVTAAVGDEAADRASPRCACVSESDSDPLEKSSEPVDLCGREMLEVAHVGSVQVTFGEVDQGARLVATEFVSKLSIERLDG